jgi:protein-S-isoprenylcysteine O-methyltransferase Ste14
MLVIPDNGHVALHNFFLEILLYLGLIGILAYAYFLFNILKEAILLSNKFYFAFVVSLLVWLCFDGGLISSKINLSTLVVVMFMIYSYKIRKEEY